MSILCRIGLHSWKMVVAATWWAPGSFVGLVKSWRYGKFVQVACKCRRCGKRVNA